MRLALLLSLSTLAFSGDMAKDQRALHAASQRVAKAQAEMQKAAEHFNSLVQAFKTAHCHANENVGVDGFANFYCAAPQPVQPAPPAPPVPEKPKDETAK